MLLFIDPTDVSNTEEFEYSHIDAYDIGYVVHPYVFHSFIHSFIHSINLSINKSIKQSAIKSVHYSAMQQMMGKFIVLLFLHFLQRFVNTVP